LCDRPNTLVRAGDRPYGGHRGHQGVHSPQGFNDIDAPGKHKVRP